jgi:uncharacterized protein YajQ (UPF0234 family)
MPSFDIVSKTDLMEVDNAINGVKREIKQRFDLSGTKCDLERSENSLTIIADDSMKLTQIEELFRKYLAQRKIEHGAFDFKTTQTASGDTVRRVVDIAQGIEKELAQKITKSVKSSKIKVQIAIQGSELRVTGKKRDDLQQIIEFVKNMDISQPLQYINFRD